MSSNKMEGKSVASRLQILRVWVIGTILSLVLISPEIGRSEQQRLIIAGATLITGTDHSRDIYADVH